MSNEFNREHFITVETEGSDEAVLLKKEIQTELVRRHFNEYEFTDEQFIEWISEYSKKFQKIFDRLIKADSHFWIHDQQTRGATLDLFEEELYSKKGKVNPEKEAENFEK